jgi:hypothetical protein
MERNRYGIWAWALLAVIAVMSVLYYQMLMPVSSAGMDPDDFTRGIGTPLLVWINGYLGVFFNLRYLGPVVGLGLPVIVIGLFRWKDLQRWERALLVFVVLAAAIIGGAGGFNYRYALTVQPLLVVAVFASVRSLLHGSQRTRFMVGLVVLSVFNTVLSLEHRQRIWKAAQGFSSPDTRKGSLRERLDTSPRDLEGMLSTHGVQASDTVLVNNLPYWYYTTDRPGIYYWCGSDQLFLSTGKPFLFNGRDDEQVMRYLVDTLHCRHVFSTEEYNRYDPRFLAFLEAHAELLEQDDRGHTLHRLKDTFGH